MSTLTWRASGGIGRARLTDLDEFASACYIYKGERPLTGVTLEQSQRRNRETSKAMTRIAESRRCPKCQRKMALAFYSDEFGFGHYCRWCDHRNITIRDT